MVSAEFGTFTAPLWCWSQCQPWWPCPFQRRALWVPAVAFCRCHSLQKLMNWLSGCCQCVCALGEGVPVTGGNPSYGIRPGATIVAVLQGALGAGGSRSSSNPHTAVTPLETQQCSLLIGSNKMTLLWRAAIPQGNYLIVPNLSWWQQLGKAKKESWHRSVSFPLLWTTLSMPISTHACSAIKLVKLAVK